MKRVITAILLGFLPAFLLEAQVLADDLKRVNASYKKDVPMAFTVEYKSFKTHTATEPEEKETALFIRKGDYNFYFEHEDAISMHNNGKTIIVDQEDKKMMVLDQPQTLDVMYDIPLDSLLLLCSGTQVLNENTTLKEYELSFDQEFFEYQAITVIINKENWLVERLVFFYNAEMPVYEEGKVVDWVKPRLQVDYTQRAFDKSYGTKLSTEHFLVEKNGKYVLATNFKEYELIDPSQEQ